MNSSHLSVFVLTAALFACGGEVSPAPTPSAATPSPTGPSPSAPAQSSPPPGPSGPSTPPPPPPPPPPLYTGAVGTTDVSILYPLPPSGTSSTLMRPGDAGAHGALLPASLASTVMGSLPLDLGTPSSYQDLALISLRFDPCSSRGAPAGGCTPEVRAVFQGIYEDPMNGVMAADGAAHVIYELTKDELYSMVAEVLALKKANGDLALQDLGPHPILVQQGLTGPFATGLRSIVRAHLGDDRIARVTAFDHDGTEGHTWTFAAFDRTNGALAQAPIPMTNGQTSQTVGGSSTSAPLVQGSAGVSPEVTEADPVVALVSAGRPAAGTPAGAVLQPIVDNALRVATPGVHDAQNTSCANCHLADGATWIGAIVYGLDVTLNAYTSPRSLAHRDDARTVTNLHAFGYLGKDVAIMQRTANESAQVAVQLEAYFSAK